MTEQLFKNLITAFKAEMSLLDCLTNVLDFDDAPDLTDIHPRDRENLLIHVMMIYNKDQEVSLEMSKQFYETINLVKNIPEILDITYITIGPTSILPLHVDTMTKPVYDLNDWFSVLLGVYVPSNDIDLLGVQIGNDIYTHSSETPIIFDTQIPHCAWNRTNDQWTCLRLRVQKTFFKEHI